MINTYRKGQNSQQKAKRYYESLGYEVEVVRYNKFSKNKDYFGLWDLICVKRQDMRFVQVKTNASPNKEWVEKANAWGVRNNCIIREWVVYRDGKAGDIPAARVTLAPLG